MKKYRPWFTLGALLALALAWFTFPAPAGAAGTFYYHPRVSFVTGEIVYADSPSTLASAVMLPQGSSLLIGNGTIFLNAAYNCKADSALIVPVRVAESVWAIGRTAAGVETYNFNCNLSSWLQHTALGGIQINSISLVYYIGVAALTTHTWGSLTTVTYVDNVAGAVGADLIAGAPALNTVARAGLYVQNLPLTAPGYLPGAANVDINAEWQAVMANTGVLHLYGVNVNFSRKDF